MQNVAVFSFRRQKRGHVIVLPRPPNSSARDVSESEPQGRFQRQKKFMASTGLICVAAATLAFLVLSQSTLVFGSEPTAYDLLQGYNFPPGLLPKGVTHYDLDASSGKFHAFLGGTCSFSLEGSYKLKYKSTISGTVSENRIKDLKGISVQILFLWVNIVEVVRDGDELEFSVGIASASFGIENFEVCPQCGCGLNCNGNQVSKIRIRPFVSSI